MTLTFHGLWMLCALGAVVFAAALGRSARDSVAMAAGLALGARLFGPERLPDPVWAGTLAATAAAIYLFKPQYAMVSALIGGTLAGMWSGLLEVQGLPSLIAVTSALIVLVVPGWLARTRREFAPELLRDEGLLAIGVLGLAVAVLPGVLDGWQAATNLSAPSERDAANAVPLWTVALLLMSMSCGALYSLWSRR